jgi:hypothetical protein
MVRLMCRAALFTATLTLGSVASGANHAAAAFDDSFTVYTTDGCGAVDFVDHGPGAPGGGDNDDYAVIHDYCADGHGVRATGLHNARYLGRKYNGNGLAGAPVVWDPFPNVLTNDRVELEVCLVDGSNDLSPSRCDSWFMFSIDG